MSEKKVFTRRQFLIGLSLTGAGVTFLSWRSGERPDLILGANDRLRIGIIGLGSCGRSHLEQFTALPGIEIGALCDLNVGDLRSLTEALVKRGKPRPAAFTDFRRIIDSHEIDAVSIATPARLHAAMAIAACEAGKDVYLERPCAITFSEGRRLVDAAAKYDRVVQQRMGNTFTLSHESAPVLVSPFLGELNSAKGSRWIFQNPANGGRELAGAATPSSTLPVHLVDQAFDEIDFARTLLMVKLPTHVATARVENIPGHTPTRVAIRMRFGSQGGGEKALHFEIGSSILPGGVPIDARLASLPVRRLQSNADGGPFFQSINTFSGASGNFTVSGDSAIDRVAVAANDCANFVSCVRSRNTSSSNFPVQEARLSCSLIQLAQLSVQYRRGFSFDPEKERVIGDYEIDGCLG